MPSALPWPHHGLTCKNFTGNKQEASELNTSNPNHAKLQCLSLVDEQKPEPRAAALSNRVLAKNWVTAVTQMESGKGHKQFTFPIPPSGLISLIIPKAGIFGWILILAERGLNS